MGDPAGIGPELTLAAWRHRAELPPFVAFDDPDNLSRRAALLGLPVPVRAVDTPEEAAGVLPDALPVMVEPLAAPAEPGKPDGAACQAVTNSLRRAVAAARARTVAAVVTNPVHKQSLYEAGFSWPGQTEFLGHLTGVVRPVMMLQATGLRVVPVTVKGNPWSRVILAGFDSAGAAKAAGGEVEAEMGLKGAWVLRFEP